MGLPRGFPDFKRADEDTFSHLRTKLGALHVLGFFLHRDAEVDHNITDLMRPGAIAPTSVNVPILDLEKEEVLTRSALILLRQRPLFAKR